MRDIYIGSSRQTDSAFGTRILRLTCCVSAAWMCLWQPCSWNGTAECCCCDLHCGIVCWQQYRLWSHNILGSFLVLCREALLRVAGAPELFLSMRGTYTASLAAVSMAGYVAGVGDRHSDNFLVDLKSGALVPIDFGQAPSHLCLSHTCAVDCPD